MATDRLDRLAIFLAAGTGGFCLGALLAPAMVNQRIQWETLATGVLAIAAAAWSVRAAMKLDREQGRRHNDTQRLTLRADRASAARAAYLAGDFFDMTYLAEVDELLADAGPETVMASNARLVQRARDWKVDIRGKLNSVLITEARPLFDPMTAVHYDTLEQLSDEIEHPLDALDAVGAFEDVELMLDRRSAVVTVMEDIRAHLKMFADDLAELGQTFL
ncbi:hypothetical protein [Mesorhizobium sp. B2-3-15]|uniref:hypothetical protein n=2 Tax=unclassified Mesorhizobium TaxID=325217 RepID=UPI0011266FF9|nr:hypothetical protein [Mesorhizobium sp. B2-3-15]TPL67456.1 hypothetical protein FJ954_24235 [Mesorhizobium sp. B2-3-15]